jgi:hypothetical protein
MSDKKIVGFGKFSTLEKKSQKEPVEIKTDTPTEDKIPMNPNLPHKGTKKNVPGVKDDSLKPPIIKSETEDTSEKKVEFYGKVAKFPNKTKASHALNFLENVKVPKQSVWYILIEKQDNELQVLKYNNSQGVDMKKFTEDLKKYYCEQYRDQPKLKSLIEGIELNGAQEFSAIRNIPDIDVENGRKLITKITEDLVKLLK